MGGVLVPADRYPGPARLVVPVTPPKRETPEPGDVRAVLSAPGSGSGLHVEIPLPWLRPPIRANSVRDSHHARGNSTRQVKRDAWYAIRQARVWPIGEPDLPINVTLHWQKATRHRADSDNLHATLKPCQDALVMAGILPDDSWVFIRRASCEIHPPAEGEPARMWLTLEAAS